MVPYLTKIKDFSFLESNDDSEKVRFCGLVLRFYPRTREYIGMDVTDFTSHRQVCRNQEYYNGGLLLERNEVLTLPVYIEALERIQNSHLDVFGEEYNLKEQYLSGGGALDVHDKLLVVVMTLKNRLYQGFLEPYSYDHEVLDYEYLDSKEKLIADDLFRNIMSHKEYFSKVSHLAPKIVPQKLLSPADPSSKDRDNTLQVDVESSHIDTKTNNSSPSSKHSHPPNPSTTNSSPPLDLVPDIEHDDFDFCNSSTVGSPEEDKIYTIPELKQLDTTLDNKTYMVKCKIIGCIPDDWMYLSGKEMDPKSNTPKDPIIRDLEWILADVDADENTVLNSENTLSVILTAQDILKFSSVQSIEEFFINCSRLREHLDAIFDKPTELEIRKVEIPINTNTTTIVWSPVE